MSYIGSKPADAVLETDDIADNVITTEKIADGTITSTDVNYPLTTFSSTGIDDNATSTAITIDSNENVGIGTTSPGNKLHLDIGTDNTGIRVNSTDTTTGIALADNGGSIVAQTTSSGAFRVLVGGDANTPGDNSSEAMRIDSSGRVLIDTTNTTPIGFIQNAMTYDNGRLAVQKYKSDSLRIGRYGDGYNQNAGQTVIFYNGGTEVGSISVFSSSTAYNTSSDYRLKENVSYDFDATTRLKQLRPARFNFIADEDTTVDGFLAHEVSSVVPEAITGTKDATETKEKVVVNSNGQVIAENIEQADWETGKIADEDGNTQYPTDSTWEATKVVPVYQGIDQAKLVPVLTKALQEAVDKIQQLEARITALENN